MTMTRKGRKAHRPRTMRLSRLWVLGMPKRAAKSISVVMSDPPKRIRALIHRSRSTTKHTKPMRASELRRRCTLPRHRAKSMPASTGTRP